MSQYAQYSTPDPEWEPAAEALKGLDQGSIIELWTKFNKDAFEPRIPEGAEYRVEDRDVPVDGGEIRVRVIVPVTPGEQDKTYPLLVFYHGGGWMIGDIAQKDYMLRSLSTRLQVVTVNVEYRLKPSPLPQDDSFAALKWAFANSASFSADPKLGFAVMGESAGAHLAAVVAQRARGDPAFGASPLTGQILQNAVLCHPKHYPEHLKDRLLSFEQNKDAPVLTADNVNFVYGFLGGDPLDPSISPLLEPSLKGLPRAFIQAAGLDPLRDESFLYADLLRDAGVEAKVEVYSGMPHGFAEPAFRSKAGQKFAQDMEGAVKWALQVD